MNPKPRPVTEIEKDAEIERLQKEVHRLRDELIEIGGKARSIYYIGYQHGDALNIMLRIQAALAPKPVEREKLQP